MVKLYRSTDGAIEYWECWETSTHFIVHSGIVGQKGEVKEHNKMENDQVRYQIEDEMNRAKAAGYSSIDTGLMMQIVIQSRIDGRGSTRDLNRAIAIEDLLSECLRWTGVGNCDGHDIGSGTLNIFCDVVDGNIGQKIIIDCLKQNGQLDGSVMARRERTGSEEYFVFWPQGFAGEFHLM